MSSTLAVVLSFRPDDSIVKNIEVLLLQVEAVVIVDNESSAHSQKILSPLKGEKVHIIFNSENRGVGEGFNQGIRWGLDKKYDYFLLMDQDSQPTPNMVSEQVRVLRLYSEKSALVLVGPHHEDYVRKIKKTSVNEIEPVPLLITSGCLLSRVLIEKVGLYDERLFIDHVDHDYCLRLAKSGGLCLKVNSAVLLHRFGEAKVKTFLGKSFFVQDYSAFRRYHMMRNRIILYKRYGMFRGAWFWLDAKVALKDLVKLVMFENSRREKLGAVFRGLVDGVLWRD